MKRQAISASETPDTTVNKRPKHETGIERCCDGRDGTREEESGQCAGRTTGGFVLSALLRSEEELKEDENKWRACKEQ